MTSSSRQWILHYSEAPLLAFVHGKQLRAHDKVTWSDTAEPVKMFQLQLCMQYCVYLPASLSDILPQVKAELPVSITGDLVLENHSGKKWKQKRFTGRLKEELLECMPATVRKHQRHTDLSPLHTHNHNIMGLQWCNTVGRVSWVPSSAVPANFTVHTRFYCYSTWNSNGMQTPRALWDKGNNMFFVLLAFLVSYVTSVVFHSKPGHGAEAEQNVSSRPKHSVMLYV